jgi:hypothetical protein
MRDNDLIDHFRRHYDAPEADNAAVMDETTRRFLKEPAKIRKVFVDSLEATTLNDEIGIRERAERLSIHRHFRAIHQDLKRVGR